MPSASSRETPSAFCVRSLVPNEKKSACGAISSRARRRPRQLDHGADRGSAGRSPASLSTSATARACARARREADQRDHDRRARVAAGGAHRARGARDGAHLHRVDLGVQQADAAAARAEHRVGLVQRPMRPSSFSAAPSPGRRAARRRSTATACGDVGQELVQRRIEQPDGDLEAVHRAEDALEVALLHGRRRRAPPRAPRPSRRGSSRAPPAAAPRP